MQTPQLTNQVLIHPPEQQSSKNIDFHTEEINSNCITSCQKKECRICFQPEEVNKEMIASCRCVGLLQFIHKSCFEIWLFKKYEESENKAEYKNGSDMYCQICHSQFTVNYRFINTCSSFPNFIRKIKTNKWIALANVIFIIVDILCLVVSSYYAAQDMRQKEFDIKAPKYFLVYVAIILALGSTVYGVYQFVRVFLLDEKIEVIERAKTREAVQKRYILEIQTPSIQSELNEKAIKSEN